MKTITDALHHMPQYNFMEFAGTAGLCRFLVTYVGACNVVAIKSQEPLI